MKSLHGSQTHNSSVESEKYALNGLMAHEYSSPVELVLIEWKHFLKWNCTIYMFTLLYGERTSTWNIYEGQTWCQKTCRRKRKRIELFFLCTIMYRSQDLFSRFCIQFCLCSFVSDKKSICFKKFFQTKLFHCLFGVCSMRFPSMMEHYCNLVSFFQQPFKRSQQYITR